MTDARTKLKLCFAGPNKEEYYPTCDLCRESDAALHSRVPGLMFAKAKAAGWRSVLPKGGIARLTICPTCAKTLAGRKTP